MRATIDKAGRLVIPRELRNRIGLGRGGDVGIVLDGAAVRIEPVPGAELKPVGELLVIPASGVPLTQSDVIELID